MFTPKTWDDMAIRIRRLNDEACPVYDYEGMRSISRIYVDKLTSSNQRVFASEVRGKPGKPQIAR
jgi:hypothetical protein